MPYIYLHETYRIMFELGGGKTYGVFADVFVGILIRWMSGTNYNLLNYR